MRLKAVYGAEFMRHFPDVESERMAKREWAKDIGQYSREQIDRMFAYARSEMARGNDDYRWLNIGTILGALACSWEQRRQSQSVHEALGYEPKGLENITERDRRKAKGKAEVAKLKAQFGW